MRELTVDEVEMVDGGVVWAVIGIYIGMLAIAQSMGTSAGEANARRSPR